MLDFTSIPQTTLVGRLGRKLLAFLPLQARMPVLQGRLRGMKWIVGAGQHGYWLGSYEAQKQRLFAALAADKTVIFDIGANVGFYTLLSGVLVRQGGKVFAFEPSARNIAYLNQHLAINRIENVSVVPVALSDTVGVSAFERTMSPSMGKLSDTGDLIVRTETLDHLYEMGVVPDPELVKIDVEGAEMRVLSGATTMLERARPIVLIATHGTQIHDQCVAFLTSLRYTLNPSYLGPGVGHVSLPGDELVALP